ncbi:hypothetical protein OZ410_03110 [Robiginitalea sp. M366]|uniref:hypothetical protein n=1 Tax=Robiginitalea aestuariiviva TaxID=3036903 RepID=UPI00240DDF66|nr:hypothetical protein [Robiginitalea aestuariiviva]MDG1571287.1 hypothetical protein [Robiginitalea aestuariiviva]
MGTRKRHWFWNLVLALSVLFCLLALAAHARTWKRLQQDRIQLLSGVYTLDLPIGDIDRMEWVPRLPQMEREHGFSAWAMEKGRFRDSLNPDQQVLVLVDNLRHRKIRIRYRDSLWLYLNLQDSVETDALYQWLELKMAETEPGAK